MLGCLWVKLSETENVLSVHDKQIGSASNLQDVTIGGVTKDGRDATNDLTFLILEVSPSAQADPASCVLSLPSRHERGRLAQGDREQP